MVEERPATALETLARRRSLLEALVGDTREKRELVSELDVSRSTINRAIAELTALGFVRREEHGFTATAAGRLAVAYYDESTSMLVNLLDARPLLDLLPPGTTPPLSLFRDATVVTRTETEPHRPAQYLATALGECRRMRAVRGPSRPELPDTLRDRFLDGDLSGELVLTRPSIAWLESYQGTDFRRVLASESVSVRVVDADPRFDVVVGDDAAAFLLVHDAAAELVGVVHSSSPSSAEWAAAFFDDQRARTRPYESAE